jgi:pimeloyl-ACP methyl ester carboxylesterase
VSCTRKLVHLILAASAGLAISSAQGAPVTYPENMICATDNARPDRDSTLHEQVASTANGPIGYYRFGHGSPLVLITGYRATLSEWNAYFLAELAKHHDVIIFDNRGIGQSEPGDTRYRVTDLAHDTASLIRTLGLGKVTVLGWSMGGMIAQQLALDEPGLVGHLILLSTAPPGERSIPLAPAVEETLSGREHSSFENIMKVLFPDDVVQRAQRCFVGDMFTPAGYKPAGIAANITAAQEHLMRDWALDNHAFGLLHRAKVRTLILSGTDDEVLVPKNSAILGKAMPHATLVEIQDGGHAIMYQYPRALARRIGAFAGNSSARRLRGVAAP